MQNSGNRWLSALFVLGGLAILTYGGSSTKAKASQSTQNVFVTNTASTPVPVLPVRNSVVYALQSGPWFTQISNTPTVRIGNATTSPVNVKAVDSGDRDGFQISGQTAIADGFLYSSNMTYTVPAGKFFSMDYISALSQAATAAQYSIFMEIRIEDAVGNELAFAAIPITPAWGSSYNAIVSQPIHLVAGPGQQVIVTNYREVSSGMVTNNVTVAGHLTSTQ